MEIHCKIKKATHPQHGAKLITKAGQKAYNYIANPLGGV